MSDVTEKLLTDMRDELRQQTAQSAEILTIAKEQRDLVKQQFLRAEAIQRRAEALQTRGEGAMRAVRWVIVVIALALALAVGYLFWMISGIWHNG